MRSIVIGCDSAGVELKEILRACIAERGAAVEDVGCADARDATPYAFVARALCEKIIESGYAKRGVLVCGTGVGMCMAANKMRGIRAAVGHDSYSAERSVLSNNGNVLCFGARVIGPELAKKIVREWLTLEFANGPSTPKVEAINAVERAFFK